MKQKGKRVLSLVAAFVMIAQMVFTTLPAAVNADDSTSVFTDYLPTINQVTDDAGFIHPGVGLTKELLENVRTKIRAGAQPWTYYFNNMLLPAPEASKTITSSNSGDGKTPSADYFNSQGIEGRFIADGVKAYAQALMYYITGDEVYRANALMIIRIWEQMDPAKYAYYRDAHIHAGVPLNRMVMAAEILRYTSTQTASLAWTDQDTANFTNNLIVPVTETFLHDQNHFMNQHTYPLLGAMAGYIFTGNRPRYNEAVEWFTVNRTAHDQGFNGSVKALFRLVTEEEKPGGIVGEGTPVEPHVQQMEMGRDQAHGGGDLTNAALITRLIHAQGTKVDPVAGTPSTADNAVDIMEFLNNRILAAANYFWQFMLGYDTPWTPQAYAITGGDPDNVGLGGTIRDTYNGLSGGYRGRFDTANFWDFYSYYTYVKHEDVSKIAPYYYEAFTKKQPAAPGAWGNKDAGNDYWLYLPPEAEADAAKFIPQDQTSGNILQLEDRYTKLDDHTALMHEGDTTFIRFYATQEGSKIAALSFAHAAGSGPFGFRIRTNGVTTFDALGSTFTLPDTKGEWKYVTLAGSFGDIVYMTVKGAPGITVDIDSVDAAASTDLTPPVFKSGSDDLKIYTYVGASVNVDLSAADASSTDTVTYEFQNNAKGLPIDANTGEFSWHPTEAGNYSVVAAATDGTSVSVKNVNVIVGNDRADAVQNILASYDPNQVYVEATLKNFKTVYQDTLNQINTASDADFDMQLQALRTATEGLELVTPLNKIGGIRWSKVVTWSTWGTFAPNMDDGDWSTGAWYGLAQGSPPHLYHMLDFGPDYKVSATKFGFKSNIFVDRLANSAVYGSNDKVNWTRLTPGVTQYTQAYQTLDVDPALQNEKFRFIKLEMIKPLPAVLYGEIVNLLELDDFDIFGTRYEIGNQIQSVSLSSDHALNGRVALGDTVKASITAKEAVHNVKVNIQGQDATVSTPDNIHYTATATLTGKDQTGDVKVSVDYTKQDGTNGDTVYGTTDGSKLFVADDSDLIQNVTSLANLIDSTGRSAADTLRQVNALFDNDVNTGSDFRLNGTGSGSYITFDFKEGNQVTLSSVELLARQDRFYGRIAGAVVQGSNDNTTWTALTKAAAPTKDWQMLAVSGNVGYRYIRIYNPNAWFGNMNEVRFHGNLKSVTSIQSVSIDSPQAIRNRIVPGNTVNVAIAAKEPVKDMVVAIQGQDAAVSSTDDIHWKATTTLNQGVPVGPVTLNITYKKQDGTDGFPATETTNDTSLNLVDESDLIRNVTSFSDLIDSTPGRSAADTLTQVNALFDQDPNTLSDFRLSNGSGSGSYITFDFRKGNQVKLSSVELLARQDRYYGRIGGAVVQGSNDNTTWTTLTESAAPTMDWQTLQVSGSQLYRYIRIYNPHAWYGNMAELRFHGKLTITEVNPIPPTGYTKGSYYLYLQEVNRIKAALAQPGADNQALIGELLQAQGMLVSQSSLISKMTITPSMTMASSISWDGKFDAATNGWHAFDGDTSTSPDTKTADGWAQVDLGAGNAKFLSSIRYMPRTDKAYRMDGALIQGSNDGIHFETLYTINGVSDSEWYTQTINSSKAYRYLRYYTPKGFANVGDLEFYEKAVDRTLLALFLDQAKAVIANRYTEDSYAALQTAVQDAKTVDANAEATQSDVDSAADSLKTALDHLIYKIAASLNPAEPNGTNGWFKTAPVSVTLSTYGKAEYSLDEGSTWQSYTEPLAFNEEGKNMVSYRSRNEAGIAGAVQTVSVNVDRTAPVTTAAVSPVEPDGLNGWYVHPVTLTSTANDTLSGVAKMEYSLDGGSTWQTYTVPVTFKQDGKYTVSYRSTDNAGNVETDQTIAFNQDTTAPAITVTGVVYGTYDDSTDLTPSIVIDDNLSGVDNSTTTATLDGASVQQGVTIPLYTLPLGSHTFTVSTSDLAGNTGSQTIQLQTTTSIQAMKELVVRFSKAGWIDNAGIANSLQSKLDANELNALVNELKAQSGKHITSEAAGYLTRDALYLLSRQH